MSDRGPPEAEPRLLTIPHVADRLDCSVRFVWTLIAQGRLTRIVLSARATRVAERELDAFIERAARPGLPPGRSEGKAAIGGRTRPGEPGG